MRRRVYVLLFPGFVLLDATGPIQVFSTTNNQCRDEGVPGGYDIHVVSQTGGPVTSASGITLLTEALPKEEELSGATLLVPGTQDLSILDQSQALCAWLSRSHEYTARTCSVCTGAFLLAASSLLDERRATTHWMDAQALQTRFPQVHVDADAIYVQDGRVWTSAGISAGIDLALALVESDLGRPLALRIAHRLVLYLKRSGGQRQYSAELHAQTEENSLSGRLSKWLLERLDKSVSVDEMASALAVSSRTLHRQLIKETGRTPAAWLKRLRLESACRALANPELSLKQIAYRSGFGDEYNMRRTFHLELGVTPSEYRKRIGAGAAL
ncbi:MAG: GlxA family transcriptional regulator [Zoogloea sp.]|nr:MAG: GlxA family transcriptional regulator [Zoogloea sp.]